MENLDKFISIFAGLDSAYGTYKVSGQNEKGKSTGQALVVRKPPTKDLWQKHFDGAEPSLGIIPIRADNSCVWGCIDIDQYPLDLAGSGYTDQKARSSACVLPQQVRRCSLLCFYKNTRTRWRHAGLPEFLRGFARSIGQRNISKTT
jgi:hypothetical protein